jgi:hypothetical protein
MNQAMFDPENFLSTETDVVNETDYTPIPENEYNAVIKELKSDVTPSGSPVLNVIWSIDDQEVKDFTGMDDPTCRQSIWLDVNASGGLESGANKNVGLGKLRAALGQNDGSPWSPNHMVGQPARVLVKHTTNKDTGAVYANVAQVAAA